MLYSNAKSLQSCQTLWDPMDYSPHVPLSMGFFRQAYWSGLTFPAEDLPDPGTEPMSPVSPALQVDFLVLSHLEALMELFVCFFESHSVMLWLHELYSPWNSLGQNTGVGSFSLLQRIFPTQGSNPGLLHCGQILYQLSHKGIRGDTNVGNKKKSE